MTETAWERELRCGDARVTLGRRGGRRFAEGRGATAVAVASFLESEIQTREERGDMLARVRARSGSIEGNAWDVSFSDHGVVLSGLYSGEIVEVEQACFEEILLGWLSVFGAR